MNIHTYIYVLIYYMGYIYIWIINHLLSGMHIQVYPIYIYSKHAGSPLVLEVQYVQRRSAQVSLIAGADNSNFTRVHDMYIYIFNIFELNLGYHDIEGLTSNNGDIVRYSEI